MGLKLQYHNATAKYQLILGYSRKYLHTLINGIEFGTKKTSGFPRKKIAVFVAFRPFIDSKSWGIQKFVFPKFLPLKLPPPPTIENAPI